MSYYVYHVNNIQPYYLFTLCGMWYMEEEGLVGGKLDHIQSYIEWQLVYLGWTWKHWSSSLKVCPPLLFERYNSMLLILSCGRGGLEHFFCDSCVSLPGYRKGCSLLWQKTQHYMDVVVHNVHFCGKHQTSVRLHQYHQIFYYDSSIRLTPSVSPI